jgi:uncharacterized protein (DUF2164 family)
LENYVDYDLTAGEILNITTLSWTGAKYYNQGIESLHAHAKDPLLRMDKDWEILQEEIKSEEWFDNLTGKR